MYKYQSVPFTVDGPNRIDTDLKVRGRSIVGHLLQALIRFRTAMRGYDTTAGIQCRMPVRMGGVFVFLVFACRTIYRLVCKYLMSLTNTQIKGQEKCIIDGDD